MKHQHIQSMVLKFSMVFLALLVSPLLQAQQAYRCEENGRTVYQAAPCAGGKAVEDATRPTAQQRAIAEDQADQEKRDAKKMGAERRERERMKGNTAGAGEMGTMKAMSTEERERREIKSKTKGSKSGKKKGGSAHSKKRPKIIDPDAPKKSKPAKLAKDSK